MFNPYLAQIQNKKHQKMIGHVFQHHQTFGKDLSRLSLGVDLLRWILPVIFVGLILWSLVSMGISMGISLFFAGYLRLAMYNWFIILLVLSREWMGLGKWDEYF